MKLPPRGQQFPFAPVPRFIPAARVSLGTTSPAHIMTHLRMNPPKKVFSRMRFQPSWLHGEGSRAKLLGRGQQHKAGNCVLFDTNRDLKAVNSSFNHTQGYVAWKEGFGFCPQLVQLLFNTKKCLSSTCQTQL